MLGKIKIKKAVTIVVCALILLIIIGSSTVLVPSGEVGIITQMSAVTGKTFRPGFHFKLPFVQGVTKINVQTQKVEIEASSASKDLQTISATIAVNYHVISESAPDLFAEVGKGYRETIVQPALQETFKSVTARYSAEELITKRQEVGLLVKDELIDKISKYGLEVEMFNIINLDFSAEFNAAIESKQTAQQNALKAQQELEKIKIDAQQKVVQAEAEAGAIKAKADAEAYAIQKVQEQLSKNPNYIEYSKIQKWDGQLPQVQGGDAIIDMRE